MKKITLTSLLLMLVCSFGWADTFVKVERAAQLVVGKEYLLVYESTGGSSRAMRAKDPNNHRTAVGVSISNKKIKTGVNTDGKPFTFILGGDAENGYTFRDYRGKYLGLDQNTNGRIVDVDDPSANRYGLWTIDLPNQCEIKNKANSYSIRYYTSGLYFACYSSGNAHIALYVNDYSTTPTTDAPTITLARSNSGDDQNYYATAYYETDMTLASDVEAYGITVPTVATGTQYIPLKKVVDAGGTLPAKTPVVLKVAKTDQLTDASITRPLYKFSYVSDPITTNLKGTTSEIDAPANSYKLRKQDGVVAFYRAYGTSILANKAYYEGAAYKTASNCLTFSFDDETAIQQVEAAETSEGATYNLAGQQVSRNYRGIVIQNGKKVLRK